MVQKYLSLGFYAERPRGEFADEKAVWAQLDFLNKINSLLDEKRVPRTFFMLGEHLESCLKYAGKEITSNAYDPKNALIEIASHSYAHPVIGKFKGPEIKVPISEKDFGDDLARANEAILIALGVRPRGLGTPLGYESDLSDSPELLNILGAMGFEYVSSSLRGKNTLNAPLTAKRQPHTYENTGHPDIVEIPSHGWQDVIFTKEKESLFGKRPVDGQEIEEHYKKLLDAADFLGIDGVCVSLCLHPWAMMEYDPDLKILDSITAHANDTGFGIKTYYDLAGIYRESAASKNHGKY